MSDQREPVTEDAVEDRVRAYIRAVEADDFETLESFYAADFENVRFDRTGRRVRLKRQTFLALLAQWRAAGTHPLPQATATTLHPTSYFPGYAASLLTRVKAGETLAYVLIWRSTDCGWMLVREFTAHERLPGRTAPLLQEVHGGDECG